VLSLRSTREETRENAKGIGQCYRDEGKGEIGWGKGAGRGTGDAVTKKRRTALGVGKGGTNQNPGESGKLNEKQEDMVKGEGKGTRLWS